MSVYAKLLIDNKEVDLLSYSFSFKQSTDATNRPITKPLFTGLHVVIAGRRDLNLAQWALSPIETRQLELHMYPILMGGKTKKIYFYDCQLVNWSTSFDATSNQTLRETLHITAEGVKDADVATEYSTFFRETFYTPQTVDDIPIAAEEEGEEEIQKKPFRIELKAANSDRKEGKFGFDTIPDEKIVVSDYEKLKKEYKPLAKKILGEEYIPSWLSLRKDQTVELILNWTKKGRANSYSTVRFEPHPDFTFEPKNLKGSEKVKITCKNNNENPVQILIKADKELIVGALNVFYPKPKAIDLEWCFVEIEGERIDYEKLKDKIKKVTLEKYFKKGLNPALIDINISNSNPKLIDISEFKENFKRAKVLKNHGVAGNYIEKSRRPILLNKIISTHANIDKNNITLYFINQKCIEQKEINENGEYPMSGGFSPTGTGIAYMVKDDNNNMLSENIIHEVMHALGLAHSFNSTYDYKDHQTDNYMDYQNTKKHTYKWQWEKLHQYSKLN